MITPSQIRPDFHPWGAQIISDLKSLESQGFIPDTGLVPGWKPQFSGYQAVEMWVTKPDRTGLSLHVEWTPEGRTSAWYKVANDGIGDYMEPIE